MKPLPHHYDVHLSGGPAGYAELSTPGVPTLRTGPPADYDGPGDARSPEHQAVQEMNVDWEQARMRTPTTLIDCARTNRLPRGGWTRDSLKPVDRVEVSGAPARNHPAIAIANFIRDSSGKPFFTGTTQMYEPEAESKAPR